METKDYLRLLKEEIHSTVIATADGEGRPVSRAGTSLRTSAAAAASVTVNALRSVSI